MAGKGWDEITYQFPNFHPTHYDGSDYLSMLGLQLYNVSKRGSWGRAMGCLSKYDKCPASAVRMRYACMNKKWIWLPHSILTEKMPQLPSFIFNNCITPLYQVQCSYILMQLFNCSYSRGYSGKQPILMKWWNFHQTPTACIIKLL